MKKRPDPADILEIQQIGSISVSAVDGLLPPEVVCECFTPDARMEVFMSDGQSIDRADGHAALVDFCRRISASNNTRRWMMNPIVEVDGDTATMRCHGTVIHIAPPTRTILRTTVQVSKLVRTSEGWRISEQDLTLDPGVVLSK